MKKGYGSIDATLNSTPDSSREDLRESEQFLDPQENRYQFDNENPIHEKDTSRGIHKHERKRGSLFLLSIQAIILMRIMWTVAVYVTLSRDREDGYQYIVVGAGPAGIVTAVNLAKRLEQEAVKEGRQAERVLLLESGSLSQSEVMRDLHKFRGKQSSFRNMQNKMESMSPLLPNDFDIPLMWTKLNEKQNEMEYLSHHWPIEETFLGRAVGGSGIHNAMINVRGLPSDFDNWNVSKWSANEIMPYYNKLEDYTNPMKADNFWSAEDWNLAQKSRGRKGPLKVSIGSDWFPSPFGVNFIKAALDSGIPLASPGFNIPEKRIGVGYYEFNVWNGTRQSVAQALISSQTEGAPSNLIIETGATVHNVLFESKGEENQIPVAKGIQFFSSKSNTVESIYLSESKGRDHNGEMQRPEIILSAGAILSSQILVNSGISRNGDLVNSPNVGKNLQDHPVISIIFETNRDLTSKIKAYFHEDDEVETFESYLNFMEGKNFNNKPSATDGTHIYGTAGFTVGGFLTSPWAKTSDPDIQLTVFPHVKEPHFTLRKSENKTLDESTDDEGLVMITVALLKPESRNFLQFHEAKYIDNDDRENDYGNYAFEESFDFHVPTIKGGKLTQLDVERLAYGIDQVRSIMKSLSISKTIRKEIYPGSFYEGAELNKFMEENIMRNSHWSGSTRMGDDDSSVVDNELKVRGTERLRVVDAGIMPIIPNGNTHSTTCVIGLRAVDLILGEVNN